MSANQLEFWQPLTVAQYVYREWLWYYRDGYHKTAQHPQSVTERTAKCLGLSIELVKRIVRIQSRWEARRTLKEGIDIYDTETP